MRAFKPALISLLSIASTLAFAQDAAAAAPPAIDKADSAFMIISTALVLLMTPALALFYGGLVHKKNVLNTMLMSFLMMGVVSIIWVVIGYSLAFGKAPNGFIGGFDYVMGQNVSVTTPYGTQTIPAALFMLFQMKFAIITPALISGAIAERARFRGYLVFMILWSIFVYSPIACWVWNADGWLFKMGALDFAGGTVVHLASGVSALALVLIIGQRKSLTPPPNNITLTLLGAGLLWFGWFGFNAGSALAMNDIAVQAFLVTHLAAAAGMVAWLVAERMKTGKSTAIGGASGLVAGLVVITPAAGFVDVTSSIIMGVLAGVVCFFGIQLKHKLGYDDALDVVGIHGIGGLLGAVLTGVFASPVVNKAMVEPLLETGRMSLIMKQLAAVGGVGLFVFVASLILGKLVDATIGLRVSEACENDGLDSRIHGESGYGFDDALTATS
ncbi:AmtB Ammonia permease [Fimbriimonadaceae bacterium]